MDSDSTFDMVDVSGSLETLQIDNPRHESDYRLVESLSEVNSTLSDLKKKMADIAKDRQQSLAARSTPVNMITVRAYREDHQRYYDLDVFNITTKRISVSVGKSINDGEAFVIEPFTQKYFSVDREMYAKIFTSYYIEGQDHFSNLEEVTVVPIPEFRGCVTINH